MRISRVVAATLSMLSILASMVATAKETSVPANPEINIYDYRSRNSEVIGDAQMMVMREMLEEAMRRVSDELDLLSAFNDYNLEKVGFVLSDSGEEMIIRIYGKAILSSTPRANLNRLTKEAPAKLLADLLDIKAKNPEYVNLFLVVLFRMDGPTSAEVMLIKVTPLSEPPKQQPAPQPTPCPPPPISPPPSNRQEHAARPLGAPFLFLFFIAPE